MIDVLASGPSLDDLLPACRATIPGEGLLGYLLRLDKANGGAAGTIARRIANHAIGLRDLGDPSFQFTGMTYDLQLLADINGQPLVTVEALTHLRRLQWLFGAGAGARAIGGYGRLRICTECIGAPEPFLALETALPLVEICDLHHRTLVSQCNGLKGCGAQFEAFSPLSWPFHCRCGRRWADATSISPSPQSWVTQRRILAAYRWLLAEPNVDVVKAARRMAALDPSERWDGGFESPVHRPGVIQQYHHSLFGIVTLLVERNLPPTRLSEVFPTPRRGTGPCRNQICRAPADAIRRNGARNGEWETYCSVCGSRFLGSRIILSFDFGHGDPHLSRRSVLRARARLARFRIAVYKTVLEMGLSWPLEEIYVDDVFRRAGVPRGGYLRASRLRLAWIATSWRRGFPSLESQLDLYGRLDGRWRHPYLARPARKATNARRTPFGTKSKRA